MTAITGNPVPRVDGDSVWIRSFHRADRAPITLVCFPHAGGSASFFFALSRALSPSVEVLAVQYPGRQDRRNEPVIEDLGLLADKVYRALSGWTGRRFAFFGHSMGASVAFEVARRMEQAGGPTPELFFASARRSPSLPTESRVRLMDDAGIVAELKRLSGTAAALFADPELMAAAIPALRGDYTAIESYIAEPTATLDCPVHVFIGDADPLTAPEQAEAWRDHATGAFDLSLFPGGHFYLETWPAQVVKEIQERIRATAGGI
jgi:pyochelin biosynthetic protein PchC